MSDALPNAPADPPPAVPPAAAPPPPPAPAALPAAVPPAPAAPASLWSTIWSTGQLVVALVVTSLVLAYLLLMPAAPPPPDDPRRPSMSEIVTAAGPGLIGIQANSSLSKKLQVIEIHARTIQDPLVSVTGQVAASLRPGKGTNADYWQFNASELLTAYTDWQKATNDIAFTTNQLERTKELATARVESQKKVVARLKKLVDAGTDPFKDLAAEETNLLQYQLLGQKEVYEAETAALIAKRSEAAYSRQLQQSGLDPDTLRTATADVDIVIADVPETMLASVKKGQACEAKFFGLPHDTFPGKVQRIAPVLSKDRHALRVLFVINDPQDQLRPGMFADIGLGTDPREALLVPADATVHVGRADYVLVGEKGDAWRVTEVRVGDVHGSEVEILDGLSGGERVICKGAILLKPAIVRALQDAANRAKGSVAETSP